MLVYRAPGHLICQTLPTSVVVCVLTCEPVTHHPPLPSAWPACLRTQTSPAPWHAIHTAHRQQQGRFRVGYPLACRANIAAGLHTRSSVSLRMQPGGASAGGRPRSTEGRRMNNQAPRNHLTQDVCLTGYTKPQAHLPVFHFCLPICGLLCDLLFQPCLSTRCQVKPLLEADHDPLSAAS